MRSWPSVGLRALMQIAGVDVEKVDSQAIGFRLGPRINAAGRLQSAMLAYNLLVTGSPDEAGWISAKLNHINEERRRLLDRQVERAHGLLGDVDGQGVLVPLNRGVLVIDDPGFHEGIGGLGASRLVDEFYRPCLVMRRGEAATRGSARSIDGFHITHALDACRDLLTRYGGHARAAGFALPNENLAAFRERLRGYGEENLTEEMLRPRHSVDALVSLEEIDEDAPNALAVLEPFGEGNPEPAFATTGLRVLEVRRVGREGRHLRMRVGDGDRSLPVIAFRQGHWADQIAPGDLIDLIYRPTLNEWRGTMSLQLVVQALRKSKGGAREDEAGVT